MYNPDIKHKLYTVLSDQPHAVNLLEKMMNLGEVLLFGGSVRTYFENQFSKLPRDFDIVLNLTNSGFNLDDLLFSNEYEIRYNKFGGYKIKVDGLVFDIWLINDTWAFKENKVSFTNLSDLNKTVPYNIDAVFYNLNSKRLYDGGFHEALSNETLDIVLLENPFPGLNITRAFRFKEQYNLKFSNTLWKYLIDWLSQYHDEKGAFDYLKSIELKRYSDGLINWSNIISEVKEVQRDILQTS